MLVLDGVTDPHNLGACLRVADGAGAHAVVAPKDHAVGINATVAKVASGAAETVPYFMVTNLARTLNELKERDIRVVGTADDAPRSLYDLDLSGPVALVLGAEGKGMRQLTAQDLRRARAPADGRRGREPQRLGRERRVPVRGGAPAPAWSPTMTMTDVRHPLVRHKVGLLRADSLSTKNFREITAELGRLLAYEATADFPLEPATVDAGAARCSRADQRQEGDAGADPARRARHARRRARRDSERQGQRRRHRPQPRDAAARALRRPARRRAAERTAIVLDPMLATGGSMISTIALLKSRGATDIRALVLVAAPEGIAALAEAHPDVRCWTAAIDSHLNENGYIMPGPRRRGRPDLRHAKRFGG